MAVEASSGLHFPSDLLPEPFRVFPDTGRRHRHHSRIRDVDTELCAGKEELRLGVFDLLQFHHHRKAVEINRFKETGQVSVDVSSGETRGSADIAVRGHLGAHSQYCDSANPWSVPAHRSVLVPRWKNPKAKG